MLTGAGTARDSAVSDQFTPTLFLERGALETIYVESWAAAKFINVPINDALGKWRKFNDETEMMVEAERRYKVKKRIGDALKAARLFGSGMVMMITEEAPLDTPLNIDAVRPGDLVHLLPVDRYQCRLSEIIADPFDPDYGMPSLYHVLPGPEIQVELDVHPSRVLRFNGISPLTTEWTSYESHWGLSELIPALRVIYDDAKTARAVAHKIERFSIEVLKMRNFDAAVAAGRFAENPDAPSASSRLGYSAQMESVYRTSVIGHDEELLEKSVSFAGLPELIDRFHLRLAAAADIPATRFLAKSPDGLNASGDSDMMNYAVRIKALQEERITPALDVLDQVLARNAGLDEPPPYEWISIINMSELEVADIDLKRAQYIAQLMALDLIEEEPARTRLGIQD